MRWKRPHHTRWLAACVLALVLSSLAGGFSLRVAAVFVLIFGIGAALLNLDDPDEEFDEFGYSRFGPDPRRPVVRYPENHPADPAGEAADPADDADTEGDPDDEPVEGASGALQT